MWYSDCSTSCLLLLMLGAQSSDTILRREGRGLIYLWGTFSWHFFFWSGLVAPCMCSCTALCSAPIFLLYWIMNSFRTQIPSIFSLFTHHRAGYKGTSVNICWLNGLVDISCSELNGGCEMICPCPNPQNLCG